MSELESTLTQLTPVTDKAHQMADFDRVVTRLFLIFAIGAVLLLYGNALEAPFILDDNGVVQSASLQWTSRSLGYSSFWASRQVMNLFGGILPWNAPFYFRFGNLLIHALAATALFVLTRELTGRAIVAAIAGTLFLVHPIQTQAVTYITQRFESLATLFMLTGAVSYVRFRKTHRWQWLAATIASCIAAGLTKETAVVLPAWLLLIELVFFDARQLKRHALYLAPPTLIIFFWAWTAFQSSGRTLTWVAWDQYLLTQGPVLTKYLLLSTWPDQQFLFYDFPLVDALSWMVVLQWAFILSVIGFGVALCVRRRSVIGFGILTFFVLLLPVTLIPLPDLIFEHRIYPAFAGLAIAAAAACQADRRKSILLAVGVMAVMWGLKTIQRNSEWNDEIRFLEMHRARFPQDPGILARLASYYGQQGMVNKALELTQEARRYEHRYNFYYRSTGQMLIAINLSLLHLAKGDADAAVKEALRAVAVAPDQPFPLLALGNARLQLPDNIGAYAAFKKLVLQDPSNAQAWSNLGIALSRLGDVRGAEIARKRAAKEAERQRELASQPYRIPPKYNIYIVFGLILLIFAATVFAFRTVWDAAKMLRRYDPSPHPY